MNRATAVIATAIAAFLVFGAIAAPVSGHSGEVKEQTIVTLTEDGNAGVEVVITYDLSNEEESQSFERLQTNEERRNELRDSVTRDLESAVSSTDASVESLSFEEFRTYEDDEKGVVVFTGELSSVAETAEDGQMTVTAFDGHEPEREFIILPPEGYEIASSDAHTPQPYIIINNEAVYESGTDFSGFELVIEQSEESTNTGSGVSTPVIAVGFVVAVGVGIGVAAAFRRR